MLNSMTGYGKGEAECDGLIVTVEIKSVNHRYADISIKLPRSFMAMENDLRKRVGLALKRGKIDVYVNYELSGDSIASPKLNEELARAYQKLLVSMQKDLGLSGQISTEYIASQKDVIQIQETELDDATLKSCLNNALDNALTQLQAMRAAEGKETQQDIEKRLDKAEQLLDKIMSRAPQVPAEWQDKLSERLAKLNQSVEWEPQRVAQEVAVFADRCDISEEISRFKSHLAQFRELLYDGEPVGRRMDFLVQELNREVNTMGSKSNDIDITRTVVALKAEFEKVREQVQNIE
ncbi:MAG: YicC family protein [Deltaproteobacteria bacterium]|nr:YicC family protein [Deltaproteobacteria bacterium]